jgi:D-sedoheptulose 7-phosphate isomerase
MLEEYMRGALLLSGLEKEHQKVKELIKTSKRLVFLGNGGSHHGHLTHDFLKVGKIPSIAIEGASLLTCLFNDYPKEEAYKEWLKVQLQDGDLVIGISSSGESLNVINAIKYAKEQGNKTITLTGFKSNNHLSNYGDINVYFCTGSYGCHEIYSLAFLHSILDDIVKENQ